MLLPGDHGACVSSHLQGMFGVPVASAPPLPGSDLLFYMMSTVSNRIAGHTMDRFFPVKTVMETVTFQDLIAAIRYFPCADIFSGKRRGVAYNQAQKTAAFFFIHKRMLASQQRSLCKGAKHGSSDHCRILPYDLHAIQHLMQPQLFGILLQNINLMNI